MEEGLSAFGLDPETLGAAPGPPSSTAYVLLETPDNDGFPAAVLQGEGFLLPLVASQGPTGSRIPCPDPPTSSTTFQHGKREVVVKPIGKGPYSCQTCRKEFKLWSALKAHWKNHENDKKFTCHLCSETFNVEKNLALHKVGAHCDGQSVDRLVCPECGKRFRRATSFKAHLSVHQVDDNLACPDCDSSFVNEVKLRDHVQREHSSPMLAKKARVAARGLQRWPLSDLSGFLARHGEGENRAGPSAEASLFRCSECGEVLYSAEMATNHRRQHVYMRKLNRLKGKRGKAAKPAQGLPEDGPAGVQDPSPGDGRKCKFCSKVFPTASQLERHERVHTGAKPFQCNTCGRAFNQNSSLRTHQKKHTGAKPFVCEICKIGFSLRCNLRSHVARVHYVSKEAVFDCDRCPCVFRKLGTLNAHMTQFHSSDPAASSTTEPGHDDGDVGHPPATLQEPELPEPSAEIPVLAKEAVGKDRPKLSTTVVAEKGKDGHIKKHLVQVRKSDDTNKKSVLCNFCDKDFRKPSDLCRHLRTVHEAFKCKCCPMEFSTLKSLRTHLRAEHAPGDEGASAPAAGPQVQGQNLSSGHRTDFIPLGTFEGQSWPGVRLADPMVITQGPSGLSLGTAEARHRSVYKPTSKELTQRPFHCSSCPAAFRRASHLKLHLRTHSGEKPFSCHICHRSFSARSTLNSHLGTAHSVAALEDLDGGGPGAPFGCDECPAKFTTLGSAKRHKVSAHFKDGSSLFLCPYCQKAFKTSVLCRRHIKMHRVEVIAASSLSSSSAGDNGQGTLQVVGDGSENVQYVIEGPQGPLGDEGGEMRVELVVRLDVASSLEGPVRNELQDVGPDEQEVASRGQQQDLSERLLMASIEEKRGGHRSEIKSLDQEVQERAGLPNRCSVCSKGFRKPIDLVRHLRIHTGEKPFACPTCGRRFSVKSTLKVHQRLHALPPPGGQQAAGTSGGDDDKIPCHICKATFAGKASLKVHMRLHTGAQPYVCPVCGDLFRTPGLRKAHLAANHRGGHPRVVEELPHGVRREPTKAAENIIHSNDLVSSEVAPLLMKVPRIKDRFQMPRQVREHHLAAHHGSLGGPPTAGRVGPDQTASDSLELIPLSIPSGSLSQALEAVSSMGEPLVGSTVRLQLNGSGYDGAVAQLLVDQNLLDQLGKGASNISVVITPQDLLVEDDVDEEAVVRRAFQSPEEVAHDRPGGGAAGQQGGARLTAEPSSAGLLQEDFDEEEELLLLTTSTTATTTTTTTTSQMFLCPLCDSMVPVGSRAAHLLSAHSLQIVGDDDDEGAAAAGQLDLAEEDLVSAAGNRGQQGLNEASNAVREPKVSTATTIGKEKKCPHCGKDFRKPSQMQRHLRIHTGEKPYVCQTCGKAFNQKNALDKHVMNHQGLRPFPCPFCSYPFSQKSNLKTHIRRNHAVQAQKLLLKASSVAETN